MSVGRVTEITSTSTQSFEDAIRQGIARATSTLRNVTSAWIKEQQVRMDIHRAGRCDMYLGIVQCRNSLPAPVVFVKFAHIFPKGTWSSVEQVIRSTLLFGTY